MQYRRSSMMERGIPRTRINDKLEMMKKVKDGKKDAKGAVDFTNGSWEKTTVEWLKWFYSKVKDGNLHR